LIDLDIDVEIVDYLADWFIYRSPPRIPEVRIPEDKYLQFAAGLRNELNQALDSLRNIASGKDLKKFLVVCCVILLCRAFTSSHDSHPLIRFILHLLCFFTGGFWTVATLYSGELVQFPDIVLHK